MDLTFDLVGRTLDGKYRVLELIGGGGMGAVYKAEHLKMRRIVAVKVLRPRSDGGELKESYLQRFQREAKMSSLISHPNAITIHDYGVEDDFPYLVMQFVEGRSLKEVLSDEASLSMERVIRIVRQVAGALAVSHKLGIVHRDLKPDNIMVSKGEDGLDFSLVVDFGIAKGVAGSSAESSSLTGTFETLGTPQYMAPEQAKGTAISPATDVYSLAVITYEMITGEPPFTADNAVELVMKHMHDAPPSITAQYPQLGVPTAAEDVLVRSLAKDPLQRPQSIVEFAEQLTKALTDTLPSHIDLPALPSVRLSKTRNSVGIKLGKSSWQFLGGVMIALFACAAGYFLFIPNEPATQVLDDNKTLDEQLIEFDRILDQNPGNALAHFSKGVVLVEMNRLVAARSHFQRAVELMPNNLEYRKWLKAVREETGPPPPRKKIIR